MPTELKRSYFDELLAFHPREKMLFLAGPRQVGKTYMAKSALRLNENDGLYFNWDIPSDRRKLLAYEKGEDLLKDLRKPSPIRPIVILDEIHKMRKFKNWLKGFYDQYKEESFLWVTGSGKLDLYQKGGDSLLGRYFLYRLHPITVSDVLFSSQARPSDADLDSDPDSLWEKFLNASESNKASDEAVDQLLHLSGFPEPFLRQSQAFLRKWQQSRRARVTEEDIRDLTRIEDVARLEVLIDLLAPRVGSPLSLNSLRQDLDVAFETIKNWTNALQRVYYLYSIRTYHKKLQRALKKEQKVFFWDWSEIEDPGSRFENFVVSHFRKACDRWTDFGLGKFEVCYLRDKDGNEVDVLITRENKPWLIAEVKVSDKTPSSALVNYAGKLNCPKMIQVVRTAGVHQRTRTNSGIIHVVSAGKLFQYLR